jgi:sulfur dioxygenase
VTTVDEELRLNPRLGGGKSEAEFVAIMQGLRLANPKKIDEALPANLRCGLTAEESVTGEPARERAWAPIDALAERGGGGDGAVGARAPRRVPGDRRA